MNSNGRQPTPESGFRHQLARVVRDRGVPKHVLSHLVRRARRLLRVVPDYISRVTMRSPARPDQPDTVSSSPASDPGGLRPADLALLAFERVTRAFAAASVPYFVTDLDHPVMMSVGVFDEDRSRALDALTAACTAAFRYAPSGEEGPANRTARRSDRRFVAWFEPGAKRASAATDCGVLIEFWVLEAPGFRRVPQGRFGGLSRVGADEPAETVRIAGRDEPTFATFKREIESAPVSFPVDVVYTWVDGADPDWQAKRDWALAAESDLHALAANPARFRSGELLRFALRSLAWNTSFVRNVFLVTDAQRPDWLADEGPDVTIVDHREIIDDDALPTFNSHAIESRLHHIDGLADHYLYLNDDVLIGRPVTAKSFFTPGGLVKITLSDEPVPSGLSLAEDTPVNAAARNGAALLEKSFGYVAARKTAHVAFPQDKMVLAELEARFAGDLKRTERARFRSPHDVSVASFLSQHGAVAMGRGVIDPVSHRYVNVVDRWASDYLEQTLEDRDVEILCVNETDVPEGRVAKVDEMVGRFLRRFMPQPSPWEKV